MNDDGIEVDLFTDVVADPPETVVHSAVRTARLARSNMIIGLGGGSSLDVAKLVALLVPEHQRLIEAYGIGNAIGEKDGKGKEEEDGNRNFDAVDHAPLQASPQSEIREVSERV